jgi:hypothetical protein
MGRSGYSNRKKAYVPRASDNSRLLFELMGIEDTNFARDITEVIGEAITEGAYHYLVNFWELIEPAEEAPPKTPKPKFSSRWEMTGDGFKVKISIISQDDGETWIDVESNKKLPQASARRKSPRRQFLIFWNRSRRRACRGTRDWPW